MILKTLVSLCLSTSCVKLFNVNFHVGRQLGQLLIMHFFFFFILLQFSLLPPTHQHSNTLFFPHQSCCVPALCRLRSKQQFISSFITSSIPPTIASTKALPFEREMKGAKKQNLHPPSAPHSPSLSTYQMHALLGRARHMEMEP